MRYFNIGVNVVPHPGGKQTTKDIAGYLEKNYHLFSVWRDKRSDFINKEIETSYLGAIETFMQAGFVPPQMLEDAAAACANKLKEDINKGVVEGMPLGPKPIPTAAAKKGVNHRLKKKKGPQRRSFIDWGVTLNSVTGWESER